MDLSLISENSILPQRTLGFVELHIAVKTYKASPEEGSQGLCSWCCQFPWGRTPRYPRACHKSILQQTREMISSNFDFFWPIPVIIHNVGWKRLPDEVGKVVFLATVGPIYPWPVILT